MKEKADQIIHMGTDEPDTIAQMVFWLYNNDLEFDIVAEHNQAPTGSSSKGSKRLLDQRFWSKYNTLFQSIPHGRQTHG